jgi:hypothetical protein
LLASWTATPRPNKERAADGETATTHEKNES